MRDEQSALRPNDFGPSPLPTWIGRVAGLEAEALPRPLASWDCRNNRLAWLGLVADGFIDAAHAARERHGAARVALVLGTSTSSIGATEDAYRALDADGGFPESQRKPLVHTPAWRERPSTVPGVLELSDEATARSWFESDAYQAIVPLRRAASSSSQISILPEWEGP